MSLQCDVPQTLDLLGCPFCGEDVRARVHRTESLFSHAVVPWLTLECTTCDFLMTSEEFDELTSKWNGRAAGQAARPVRLRVQN